MFWEKVKITSSTLSSRCYLMLTLSSLSSLKNLEIWVMILTDWRAFLYSLTAKSYTLFFTSSELVNCLSSWESASRKWTSSERLMYACSIINLYNSLLDYWETSNINSLIAFSITYSTIWRYPWSNTFLAKSILSMR